MKTNLSAPALNAIIRDLINTRGSAACFAARVWGLSTHYNLGVNHPLVGYSVPNFEFEDGATIDALMHDGHGISLHFDKNTMLQVLAH